MPRWHTCDRLLPNRGLGDALGRTFPVAVTPFASCATPTASITGPCDAWDTRLAAESVDCITSTNTLEYIPPADILAILRECRRLLRPGGVMCHRIDYLDHYSYFDKAIHPYHFLRYSDDKWRWFNSSLHYQNRLRHRDYLSLFRQAGFDVIEDRTADGAPADLMTLSQFPIDAAFQGYSHAELAIRRAFVVLRKTKVLATVPL